MKRVLTKPIRRMSASCLESVLTGGSVEDGGGSVEFSLAALNYVRHMHAKLPTEKPLKIRLLGLPFTLKSQM